MLTPLGGGGGVRGAGEPGSIVLSRPGEGLCWTWSVGPSCAGNTSSAGSRSRSCARSTGLARNTIRLALRSQEPPSYERRRGRRSSTRSRRRSMSCCAQDPKLPGVRVRELIEPLGFDGGKSIVDDYLREVRPLFLPRRTFQRDGLSPGRALPVGSVGDLRACPGRAWPAASGVGRGGVHGLFPCRRWGADLQQASPGRVVGHGPLSLVAGRAARGAGLGPRGVPARRRWAPDRCLCRVLRAADRRLAFLPARRPAGEGRRGAAAGVSGEQLRAGRRFANHLDFQLQLDDWFQKANAGRTGRSEHGPSTGSPRSSRQCERSPPQGPMPTGVG